MKIPAGVREGSRIRIAGKGEPGLNGGPPGDLYVVTRVAPSPVFKQVGDHLEVEVPITIAEAVRGGTVEVPTLDGTKKIRVPAGTTDGSVQRLRGEGPAKLSGSGRGDIHYRFRVQIPKSLTKEQQRGVRASQRGDERQPACRPARPRPEGGLMADELFSKRQGVFMISVAARLAGMHPQTLRVYEERGLIKPARSPKQTRLYSQRDVERLKRIQELTTELGMNLAGVERVLEMEELMEEMQGRMDAMQREMLARINEVHRSYKRELVRWEPPGDGPPRRDPVDDRMTRGAMQADKFTIKSQEAVQAAQASRTSAATRRSLRSTCSPCCSSRTAASSSRCWRSSAWRPRTCARASRRRSTSCRRWPARRRRSPAHRASWCASSRRRSARRPRCRTSSSPPSTC